MRGTKNELQPSAVHPQPRNQFNFSHNESGGKMAASFIVQGNKDNDGEPFKGGTSRLDAMLGKKQQQV